MSLFTVEDEEKILADAISKYCADPRNAIFHKSNLPHISRFLFKFPAKIYRSGCFVNALECVIVNLEKAGLVYKELKFGSGSPGEFCVMYHIEYPNEVRPFRRGDAACTFSTAIYFCVYNPSGSSKLVDHLLTEYI